jgi:hypothetical protein
LIGVVIYAHVQMVWIPERMVWRAGKRLDKHTSATPFIANIRLIEGPKIN